MKSDTEKRRKRLEKLTFRTESLQARLDGGEKTAKIQGEMVEIVDDLASWISEWAAAQKAAL